MALRLGLVGLGWPKTNSDEGTMGLMALHIAAGRHFPVFFYGQAYMGADQAYQAAGWFRLLGASLVTLRLAAITPFAGFLLATYGLGRLVYPRGLVLTGMAVAALGSTPLLEGQLRATGGTPETLLCGTVLLWVATWIWLHGAPARPAQYRAALGVWGLAAGFALWSSLLAVPFIAASGVLLLACRRCLDWRTGCWALVGLLVGALPLLGANLTVAPGHDTWSAVARVHHDGGTGQPTRPMAPLRQVVGLVAVALPFATGGTALSTRDPAASWPYGPHRPSGSSLLALGWGLAVIGLWATAAGSALQVLWGQCYRRGLRGAALGEPTLERRRAAARLVLLATAALTVAGYATSPAPGLVPQSSSRYLVGVLVAVPAVLQPLWECGAGVHAAARLR